MAQMLALSLLSVIFFHYAKAATCTWNCGATVTFNDAFSPYCWSCSDGGNAPNITHDISLDTSVATAVSISSSLSLRTLSINGIPLTLQNGVLSLFLSLTTTNSAVTITRGSLVAGNPYGIRISVNINGGSLAADSVNFNMVNFDSTAVITVSGNSSWANSDFSTRNSTTFVGNNRGMQLWALDGTQIHNYGSVTIGTAAFGTFEFLGDESTLFANEANSWITVGQGSTPGEIDMDMSFYLTPTATLNILPNKELQPKWFHANQATIILDGILRFDHVVSANIATVNFVESTPGTLASYNDGRVIITTDIYLPMAALEISGGQLGFITPTASLVTNATGTFKTISVTSGGQIGNHGDDLTTRPIHATLNAETFSVVQGEFDMMEGFGLEINADIFILQDWIALGDHTTLHLASGMVVINADIRGDPSATDSLIFGNHTEVQLYEPGQKWINTTVQIQNDIKIFPPISFAPGSTFVDASQSTVVLNSAQVEVVLNNPPSSWGQSTLLRANSLENPASISVSGSYACLGSTVTTNAQGLILDTPVPAFLPPQNLSASVVGGNAVLRWAAPTSLPCHTNVTGYSVHIGNGDVYPTIQRSLALDVSVFPTCQVFEAHVVATVQTDFGFTTTTPESNTDLFTNIPVPAVPTGLASNVVFSNNEATATLVFSKNSSVFCQCSDLLVASYYEVSYLNSVVNVTEASVSLTNLPTDHDLDFSVLTVCQYSVDPHYVMSPSTVTRVSTSQTPPVVTQEHKISDGGIVGITLGVVGAAVLGFLIGLLVAKRAYVRFGSDDKAVGL